LDVFLLAGCDQAFTTTVTVRASVDGIIALKFKGVNNNPFVSFIDIRPL
jgi:hypothetical protein